MSDTTYTAAHMVDESGATYLIPMTDRTGISLREAIDIAETRTALGQAGCVIRDSDGAVLALDGSWIIE